MLSRRLFDEVDDLSVVTGSIQMFLTPEKQKVKVAAGTPGINRKLFEDSEESSSFNHVRVNASKRQEKDTKEASCLIQKKHSDDIKNVVNILSDNEDMIADGSRPYILPTVKGKHQDLRSITPQTLADVVNGQYDDVIDNYRIIDCRYPYEYEGGHIKGAENIYLHQTILTLLQQPTSEKQILIFHCEFSSERGPKMLRFLRSQDRELNKENYPSLNFPEIYLLDGGYKAYFCEKSDLCVPVTYLPMLHSDHTTDLRHFRVKSKSWTAGEKRQFARKAMRL